MKSKKEFIVGPLLLIAYFALELLQMGVLVLAGKFGVDVLTKIKSKS